MKIDGIINAGIVRSFLRVHHLTIYSGIISPVKEVQIIWITYFKETITHQGITYMFMSRWSEREREGVLMNDLAGGG